MKTDVLADCAVRERALDPGQSFIVEAPAGSGKTTLLTQRFLRLLSVVDQPESIVALTFTRKAAEEMRGRVLDALRTVQKDPAALDPVTQAWASAALAASDAGGWRLLECPRRLRMQTIDPLSATLAKRGPLLSGYTGNAEVLEDAEHLYRAAAHAAITGLGDSGHWADAIRILLRHHDNDWERLEGLLADMLSRRDQWLRFIIRHPDRGAFEHGLNIAIGDELRLLAAAVPSGLHENMIRLGRFAGKNLQRDYPDAPGVALADLAAMPSGDSVDLVYWKALAELFLKRDGDQRSRVNKKDGFPAKGDGIEEYKSLFAALASELTQLPDVVAALKNVHTMPEPHYSEHQWQSIEALFTVLKLAAAELKIAFDRAGAVDFVEISHAALAALGAAQDPSDLGLILDYQIQHLLIDEFQDTSITQFELIERLLDGWSDGDGRSLFVVGDPMQSIYRFRQADVNLFIDTCATGRIAAIPLEVLQLTTNFRAQAALIEWINQRLTQMRADSACPFVQMPQLVAARPLTTPHAVDCHGFIANDDRAEAAMVVDIVRRSQATDPSQTIGILVRGRRHLGSISAALNEADIYVAASEIDRLRDQTIIQDLVALTRALLHPADRTAWLGVLRAPWCGISLKSLAVLFEGETNSTIWQRLSDGFDAEPIAPEECEILSNVCSIIAQAQRSVGRKAIAPLIERTWIALGGPDAYVNINLSHAERYFELLNSCARNDALVSAKRLDDLLDRQYVAPSPQAPSSVQIMTIHRAKGLEFDVVILPGLGRVPQSDRHRLLEWKQQLLPTGPSLLCAPIPRIGSRGDAIHAYLHGAEKKELENEGYRLLYVALTRARETLHLIGSVKADADGGPADPAPRSFLKMLKNSDDEGWEFSGESMLTAPLVTNVSRNRRQQLRRPKLVRESQRRGLDTGGPVAESAARAEVEFAWASPIAKHVGTVAHTILQLICADGSSQWSITRVRDLVPYIESRLRGIGVNPTSIVEARERIVAAVVATLNSQRGRWIMADQHADAQSEFALSSVVESNAVNVIIDRTFIDLDGVRWIIDFKTGTHVGGNTDAFIASEIERYRPQLQRYAELMLLREDRPIALGLFFPLLDEWREWRYSAADTQQDAMVKFPTQSA